MAKIIDTLLDLDKFLLGKRKSLRFLVRSIADLGQLANQHHLAKFFGPVFVT
jgi:hypothetical protein